MGVPATSLPAGPPSLKARPHHPGRDFALNPALEVYVAIALGALAGIASRRLAGSGRAAAAWGRALSLSVYPLVAAAGLAAGSALAGVGATPRLAGLIAYYALAPTAASVLVAWIALSGLRGGERA